MEDVKRSVRHRQFSVGQKENKIFRRSIFVVKNVKKDEILTEDNIRVIRPAYGLEPKYYEEVLGKKALRDIESATPLTWEMVK